MSASTTHARITLLAALAAAPLAPAATITVDTVADSIADDGACALREALDNAAGNAQSREDCAPGAGADVIAFDPLLFAGTPALATILLQDTLVVGGGNFGGDLEIAPPDGTRVVLQGSGSARVLTLDAGESTLVLRDVEVRGGRAQSGAGVLLASLGPVTLERVHFVDNVSSGFPGGGALLRNLSAGGAPLTLRACLFEANVAESGGGGALYVAGNGSIDVLVEGGTFRDNHADFAGGAIRLQFSALADEGTPRLLVDSARFLGNAADRGGAIAAVAQGAAGRLRVEVADSLFDGNGAQHGGGALAVDGDDEASTWLSIDRSSFVENSAGPVNTSGGAVQGRDIDAAIVNNLFLHNTASRGAALLVESGATALPRLHALVGNSFFGNDYEGASGGARTLVLAANAPDSSGWQWRVAGNLFDTGEAAPEGECAFDGAQTGLELTAVSNLGESADCLLGPSDLLSAPEVALTAGTDALHPFVLYPQPGSAAIDAWPVDECVHEGSAVLVDLAGMPRPLDGDGSGGAACDIGAFEVPEPVLPEIFADGFED